MRLCGGRDIDDASILQESPYTKREQICHWKTACSQERQDVQAFMEKGVTNVAIGSFPQDRWKKLCTVLCTLCDVMRFFGFCRKVVFLSRSAEAIRKGQTGLRKGRTRPAGGSSTRDAL